MWFQRAENAAIAAVATIAFVEFDFAWWWLAALFLVFDVSMLGYLGGPSVGAWSYNAIHSYIGPAAFGAVAVLRPSRQLGFLALLWAFHIGVDRALGYGLKLRDRFTRTHLGELNRRPPS